MSTEDEKWREQFAANGEQEGSREGYKPYNREYNHSYSQGENAGGERTGYGRSDRPMRPRIQRGDRAYTAMGNGEGRTYRPRINREGMNGERVVRSHYGNGEGEENATYTRPQRNYESSGYRRENGYQQREGGYQSRQGGYRREGGYQQREGGYRREGGYQQREGGYQSRQGGYRREGGYQQREGGYQNNGFRPRFNREGGYNNQGGGYNRFGGGRPQHRTGDYDPNAKYSHKKQIEYKELNMDPDAPIRLNKFLANAGVCSRREADEFITAGVVTVNGEVATELGTKVKRSDEVKFHDQLVSIEKKVYVLLNKPKDYVTTSEDPQNRKTVMDLVRNACRERIYPVGRLDRNTTGVLLLTNDGELASKLTHPKYLKKKIYHVYTDKNVTAADMRQMAEGIQLEDGEIRADAVEYASETDKKQVGIEIHSGKNRIVRRIFESLGYRVIRLDRVFFAGLTKKNLRRGDWRFLTEKEVNMLRMGAFE
ncbi:MAG: RNA-binding S4 domain-containing protein [Clostridium sp.]|nr:RNA-binding S4 domain-containing protein [Clostridium sp.]